MRLRLGRSSVCSRSTKTRASQLKCTSTKRGVTRSTWGLVHGSRRSAAGQPGSANGSRFVVWLARPTEAIHRPSTTATQRPGSEARCEAMNYLHTMLRVTDLETSIDFFCNKLGLVERRRKES